MPGHAGVDRARVGRELKAHFFAVELQPRAVAGTKRAVHIVRAIVQEKGFILVLTDEPQRQILRLIERTLIFIQLVRIV